MPDLPPSLSRYQILAELGRGMFGVVYRAHDPDLGRDVALKVIRPVGGAAEEGVDYEKRFLLEARSAAQLSHPAIVVVHDVGRDPATGSLYMALELLRGRTLDAVLRAQGPLAWREALRLARTLAEALHEAHSKGVVHRDVKPANVMVLESGEPKIMDFGIAKVEASALTAAGQLFGTPLYMSPEQALGRPVDSRSDLFSLGSVLYELLTGRKAFAAESVPRILLEVANGHPPPPSTLVTGLPADVDYAVARCLAKDPGRRYPDGRALADDLADILGGAPPRSRTRLGPVEGEGTRVSARVQPPAEKTGRPAWPGPTRMALLGAAAVLLGVGGAYLARTAFPPTVAPSPESPPPSPAPTASPTATPESLIERAVDRVSSALGVSASARLVIDFEHSLKSGTLKVWVDGKVVVDERLDGMVAREIAGLKLHKGKLSDSLELAPGRHTVRVEVEWEGTAKSQSISALFEAGKTRRLEARLGSLGGLRRNLSLEWR